MTSQLNWHLVSSWSRKIQKPVGIASQTALILSSYFAPFVLALAVAASRSVIPTLSPVDQYKPLSVALIIVGQSKSYGGSNRDSQAATASTGRTSAMEQRHQALKTRSKNRCEIASQSETDRFIDIPYAVPRAWPNEQSGSMMVLWGPPCVTDGAR